MYVLGGAVGIEMACGVKVPTTTGRGDATQEQTDIDSFDLLKPKACGFRNYSEKRICGEPRRNSFRQSPVARIDPSLTLLVGIPWDSGDGVWTDGKLDNPLVTIDGGECKSYVKRPFYWSFSDLVFGSGAIAEVYAQNRRRFYRGME